jgi:hypothetical protein
LQTPNLNLDLDPTIVVDDDLYFILWSFLFHGGGGVNKSSYNGVDKKCSGGTQQLG